MTLRSLIIRFLTNSSSLKLISSTFKLNISSGIACIKLQKQVALFKLFDFYHRILSNYVSEYIGADSHDIESTASIDKWSK
jgi:hypothetical protein